MEAHAGGFQSDAAFRAFCGEARPPLALRGSEAVQGKNKSHGSEASGGPLGPNKGTIEQKGPWGPCCNKTLQLIKYASNHFASILLSLAKLLQGGITLAAGFVVGTISLRVVIPAIQSGSS